MEIRDLDPGDVDAALDVRDRSFGLLAGADADHWRTWQRRVAAEGRALAAYDGGRVVAMARVQPFRQWWYGRVLPLGGVAGVVVAPEYRGRRVGGTLMRALLQRMVEQGYPLSALFPASLPVYRGVGYELAGYRHRLRVTVAGLRGLARGLGERPLPVRVGPGDAKRVNAAEAAHHEARRSCGPVEWPEDQVEEEVTDHGSFAYLTDDGYLHYRWGPDHAVHADRVLAGSPGTARALWAQLGSGPVHTTMTEAASVVAQVPPDDPVSWLLADVGASWEPPDPWMLRLLDAPAAIAGRGFPAAARVDALLAVTDEQLPANTGTWRLVVAGGRGELAPFDGPAAGAPALPARGLAALYAGVPTATLRIAGLLAGGTPEADEALDTAFRCTPFMLDHF